MNKISKIGLIKAAPIAAGLLLLTCLNASAQNLLVESTFDSNASVASWVGLSDGFDADYNVTNFFRYDADRITTDNWIADNNFSNVGQVVSGFTGDETYDVTVSAFYNTATTTGSYDIFAKFVFLDGSDSILSEIEASHDNVVTVGGSGFVTLYDSSLLTPTGTSKINVLFFANENGADAPLSLDALSFTAVVPESGTYALLAGFTGLCFVMLSRRRVKSA